jgi:acetylornithine/succinyldiaminopimelate/putrescine aminotransferase
MIRERIPNFFRLYMNPYVAQTCLCLSRYVEEAWPPSASDHEHWQSFLANSFDEGLSGAIKLARYTCNLNQRSPLGLVIDPERRLGPFASVSLTGSGAIEFVPMLRLVAGGDASLEAVAAFGETFGFAVLLASASWIGEPLPSTLAKLLDRQSPLLVLCLDRSTLALIRDRRPGSWPGFSPDIVLFDESFVNREVPFAAFTARRALFEPWNKSGGGTFHSTTFQPNTISTLHFLDCLRRADPAFHEQLSADFARLRNQPRYCVSLLGDMYNRFLARAIESLKFDTTNIQASGHYVACRRRRIFDGVAGVASSIRGHNPDSYVSEIEELEDSEDCHEELSSRLKELTGLGHMLPAVSGASTVENALRLALVAQFPRRHVLALKGGFAGKTLLSLTGTANSFYKSYLDPLYEHVTYVDPFAPSVVKEIDTALDSHDVAVAQLELIQAVGGVRPIPQHVLDYLEEQRRRRRFLLFIDEVQTGMWRTGPFALSAQLGLSPDILTIGKGTSDMMFPFALTLYSDAVKARVDAIQPELTDAIRRRYGFEVGYKSVLNTLRRADESHLADHVREAGHLFADLLAKRLAGCRAVHAVRAFGLLIGIELDTTAGLRRYLKKRLSSFYLLGMLGHPTFPLLIGWCQYEPHVLKVTPPLSVTRSEIHQMCETIGAVLERPLHRLVGPGVGAMLKTALRRKWKRSEDYR